MTICLDIPVPRCVREILLEPPVCPPTDEDNKALELIKSFGVRFHRPEDEIKQACNLAAGLSDLAIILERPREDQPFSSNFDEFVKECETLKRVDELIRLGSKGARSIHTVTVLDAFTFSPTPKDHKNPKLPLPPPDKDCHELIEQIVNLKRPKVILACWQGVCRNPFVLRFKSLGVGTYPILTETMVKAQTTNVIQSFHPGCVLNYDVSLKLYCRMLLMCHFILAFRVLAGSTEIPEWIETIRRGSYSEIRHVKARNKQIAEYPYPTQPSLRLTATILSTLLGLLENKGPLPKIPSSEDRLAIQQRYEVNKLLGQLFASKYANGSLGISRLCLLWMEYRHPAQKEVMDRLIELGSKQHCFQLDSLTEFIPSASVCWPLRFADEDSEVLEKFTSLVIEDNPHSNPLAHNEDVILSRLRHNLRQHKSHIETTDRAVAKLASRIQLSINMQLSVCDIADRDLLSSIAELAKEFYHRLQEITALVASIPALVAGDCGVHKDEEQPKRSILERADIPQILDQIITDAEPLVEGTLRCLVRFSGLLTQAKLILAESNVYDDGSDDEVSEVLTLIPIDMAGYVKQLHSGLKVVMGFRLQQDAGEKLFETEHHTIPVVPSQDKNGGGLREMYKFVQHEVTCKQSRPV